MLEIRTNRLIGLSDMVIDNGTLKSLEKNVPFNLLEIIETTGRESGFQFYLTDGGDKVCHIAITNQRNCFEISYGTVSEYRRQGYMREALNSFIEFVRDNTNERVIWALPSSDISENLLLSVGFSFDSYYDGNDGSKWYVYRFDE